MARQHTQRATLRSAYDCLQASCPDFITKDQWPPNLPDMNPMDYCVGCNVGGLLQLKTKPKTIAELKQALQVIWGNLPQGLIDKAVKDFSK